MKLSMAMKYVIMLAVYFIAGATVVLFAFLQNRVETHDRIVDVVELAQNRLAVADQVAAVKYTNHEAIEDQADEAKIVAAAQTQAQQEGLDVSIAKRVVESQIQASKEVQNSWILKWSADNTQPQTSGNSEALRSEIAQDTTQLLKELKEAQGDLSSKACKTSVDTGYNEVLKANPSMNDFQKTALKTAISSICTP